MSFRIAAASSDGRRVDAPFGRAEKLYIYESAEPGTYSFLECRHMDPGGLEPAAGDAADSDRCGCGDGAGCHSGHGGAVKIQAIEDCRFFLCSHIGPQARKALERHAITVFEIDEEVDAAVEKIARFYNRLNGRGPRGS